MKEGTSIITSRHKKAAKNIGKHRTMTEALIKSDYSESYAESGHIKNTKGWNELMEKGLPDSKLLKVHQEGLEATKETFVGNILPDFRTRGDYLDKAYKLKGKYAPEKHEVKSISVQISKEIADKHGFNEIAS